MERVPAFKTSRMVFALAVLSIGLVSPGPLRGEGGRRVDPPAGPGSGMYGMATDRRGGAYLIWIEPTAGNAHQLRFSRLARGAWSAARTIASGSDWFVNWADHPSITVMPDGSLAAHWLVNNPGKSGTYGYGIRVAHSVNGGAMWREVFNGGTDNLEGNYSGFVSFLPGSKAFDAAYLTPPPERGDGHIMTLSLARFGRAGTLRSNAVIDPDACSCCTTTMVHTSRGPIIAYRDHEPGEVRDISIVREVNGRWTSPQPVHRDGWTINGCPTNGPALDAAGERVAAAWFTAANNTPRVKVAFSSNAGERFGPPAVVDGGQPVGWPATVLLDDGAAIVSWLESTGGGAGEIRVRRVEPDGKLGTPVVVASAAAGRSTGIPQMVRAGSSLVLAWRSAERVVAAVVPIPVSE